MSLAFLPDLKASRDLRCAIRITTATAGELLTGVKDVNEDDEYVVVYAPQSFGDVTTTRTLLIGDIVSVMLLPDTDYSMRREAGEGSL